MLNFFHGFHTKHLPCRKTWIRLGFFIGFCILGAPLGAQQVGIRGRVIEKPSNRPVSKQKVNLVSVRESMRTVSTFVTDDEGKFATSDGEILSDGVYLLNLFYKAVRYDIPLVLDGDKSEEVTIDVYGTTESPAAIRVRRAQIFLSAEGKNIQVQEAYEMENHGDQAFSSSTGTFSIRLDPAINTPPVITATGVMNLPIPQTPKPTGEPGEFFISYPLKPGVTVVHISYEGDYSLGHYILRDRVPFRIDRAEVRVSPGNLRISSPVLSSAGPDASTGLARWVVTGLEPNSPVELYLEGESGPVREARDSSGEIEGGDGGVIDVPNAVDQRKWTLLVLMFLVMIGSAAFFLFLARRGAPNR